MDFISKLKRNLNSEDEPQTKRLKFSEETALKNHVLQSICDMIKNEFTKESTDINVFKCYRSICNNAQTQSYLKKNLHSFNSMFQGVLNLTIISLKKQDKAFAMLCLQCIDSSLDFMLDLCRMSSTRSKAEEIFLNDLIFPLCTVASNDYLDINFKLNICIKKLIFNKINKPKLKDEKEIDNLLIFQSIQQKVTTLSAENIKLCFNKIMEIAKETNDVVLMDFVFRKLISCLTNSDTKSFGVDAALNCLKTVTLDFDHKIQDKSLTLFLEDLLEEILTKQCLIQCDYNILKAIAEMNAVILENKNEALLTKLILGTSSVEMNSTFYTALMKLLLQVSVQLKRETKFVLWLLNAVKGVFDKRQTDNLQIVRLLEPSFLKSFSDIILRIENKGAHNILKTLMYFLKVEVVEQMNKVPFNYTLIMFQTVTELLISFFNGVAILDYTRTELTGEKFLQTMTELHGLLNELLRNYLKAEYNTIFTNCFLRLNYKWEFFTWIFCEHYDYKHETNLTTLSDEEKMKKLIKRVMKSGDNDSMIIMYKYVAFRVRAGRDYNNLIKYTDFMSDMSKFWSLSSQEYNFLIQLFNRDQISEFTSHICEKIFIEESTLEFVKDLFKNETLENNASFTVALICQICLKMSSNVECEEIRKIIRIINFEHVFNYAVDDSDNHLYNSVLQIKKETLKSSGKQINVEDSNKIKKCLQILRYIKVEFLSLNFKRILFILLYKICEICKDDVIILEQCCSIFSDLFYGNEEEFSKCVDLYFFFNESLKPYLYTNLFKRLLKKKKFVKKINNYVLSNSFELDHASTLFRCIEEVSLTCNNNAKVKVQVKMLHNTVCNLILQHAKVPMINPNEIKALTLSIQNISPGEDVNDNLQKSTIETLQYLMEVRFKSEIIGRTNDDEQLLLNATQKLAMKALKRNICKNMKRDVLMFLYKTDVNLKIKLSSLFDIYTDKDFIEYYNHLHKQLIVAYETTNKDLLTNYVLNWIDIIQADVGTNQEIRIKNLTKAVTTLFSFVLCDDLWELILQFIRAIVTTTKFAVTATIIDMCIIIIENCLQQCEVSCCLHTLQFCSDILIHRAEFAADRASVILKIFENSVKYIIRESRITGEQNRTKFTVLLNVMEKVAIILHKFKKDIGRSNVYTISNFIHWYSEGFVLPYVKESLQTCIGSMLSTCDQYAIAFLRRCLPDAEQKIFDAFYDSYKRHYKFTGKI